MKSESGASPAAAAKFGLDTHCLVALVAEWHPRHRATVAGYGRRLAAGERAVIAGHALLECFSVLTRLPGTVRIRPETAQRILTLSFAGRAEICGLEPEEYWMVMRELERSDRGGGLVHDAAIALASYRGGARVLLTWNARDMRAVAPPGLEVAEP